MTTETQTATVEHVAFAGMNLNEIHQLLSLNIKTPNIINKICAMISTSNQGDDIHEELKKTFRGRLFLIQDE